ncbi:MAG TPA: phage holin family protein [Puia sp.]|nr:phage holin family protein [Puia sp.]
MEEFIKFENLIDHTRDYVNTRVDEAKLAVARTTSGVAARIIAGAVVGTIFLISLLFASAAAAYRLGREWGQLWLGLLAVAAFYFLLGLLIWAARERMIRVPIMNSLIHQLFKNEENEED